MKKLILFIATLLLALSLFADDGYYTTLYMLSGNFYTKQEHPFVSMEKEFLELSLKKNSLFYNINFIFKNNSDKEQVVKTAFPVKVQFELNITRSEAKPFFYAYALNESDPDSSKEFFNAILRLKTKNLEEPYFKTEAQEIIPAYMGSKEFQKIKDLEFNKYLSYKDFKKHFYLKENNASYVEYPDLIKNHVLSNFKVYQNKKKLNIKGVYLTLRIEEIKKGKYPTYKAKFDIHFLHQLILKPQESILVVVNYKVKSRYRNDIGSSYHQNSYVLGTGRTWRGNIKELLIKTPYYLTPDLPKIFKKVQKEDKKYNYYLALNYEPKRTDDIDISFSLLEHNNQKKITNLTGSKQTFDLSNIKRDKNIKSETLSLENENKLEQNSNPTSKKELQAKKAASVKKSQNKAPQNNEMSPYILYGAFLLIGMLIVFLFLLKKRSSHK